MPRVRGPVDLVALVDRACVLARTQGAVPRAQMKTFRPHLAELEPRLVERGLEVGSTIRVPLETQLLGLAEKGFFALKGLDRKLGGATAREIKSAVDALVLARRLTCVVRDSGVGYVGTSAPALDPTEIQAMLVIATKLAKLLKSAARGKKGVLREDVAMLTSGVRGDPLSPAPRLAATSRDGEELVQEIVRRVRSASTPTHVPALLRSMGLSAELGRRVLLDGAARGLFELEPESGMGRLSREDADLCPPGPMGTRLSWIRARIHQGARS
jgi:hypothetical protein